MSGWARVAALRLPDWWTLAEARTDGRRHRALAALVRAAAALRGVRGWLGQRGEMRRELQQARRDILGLTLRVSALAVAAGCPDRDALLDFPPAGDVAARERQRRIERSGLSLVRGGVS